MMLMEQKTRNNRSRTNSNSSPKKSTYSGRFGTNKQSFGGGALVWLLSLTVIIAIGYYGNFGVQQTEAYPVNLMMQRKYPVNIEVENPEELISTLDNLIQNILVGIDQSHTNNMINVKSPSSGTNKRGIDLGLSRGFSGSQAAKHLMGMSAASFANGPGRRR